MQQLPSKLSYSAALQSSISDLALTCIGNCVSSLLMQAAAQEGDTAPPALDDVVDLHFVALVNQNNRLVELDGRKSFPIDHGKTTDSTLLQVGRCCEPMQS